MLGCRSPKFEMSESGPERGHNVHVLPPLKVRTRWHKNHIRAHILGKATKIGLSTCANTLTKGVSVKFAQLLFVSREV